MIWRVLAGVFLLWALGFVIFVVTLPRPASLDRTEAVEAVIVPTGGKGRIARGLELVERKLARKILISGVDPEVKPKEFAAEFDVSDALMACCVTLGYGAVDTRSNAKEAARWVEQNGFSSVRLVTTDWHMRRAAIELERELPSSVRLVRDAVPSDSGLAIMFLEYNKLIASWLASWTR